MEQHPVNCPSCGACRDLGRESAYICGSIWHPMGGFIQSGQCAKQQVGNLETELDIMTARCVKLDNLVIGMLGFLKCISRRAAAEFSEHRRRIFIGSAPEYSLDTWIKSCPALNVRAETHPTGVTIFVQTDTPGNRGDRS